jgi:carboxyl-terminal processing protease
MANGSSSTRMRPFWLAVKITFGIFFATFLLALAGLGLFLGHTGIGGSMWALAKIETLAWINYTDPLSAKQLREKALNGFAEQLDAHSQYFSPADERDFLNQINGSFGGVGIVFGVRKHQATALMVYPDSPADRAGVKAGDVLVRANGKDIDATKLAEELRRVRGPVGSEIRLDMTRAGKALPTMSVRREQIDIPSLAATLIPADKSPTGKPVGVIQLREFSSRTPQELAEALEKLFSGPQKPASLIVDERGNPGGVLDSAVAVSAFFLPPSATVVSSLARSPNSRAVWHARATDYWSGPLDDDPVQKARGAIPGLADIPLAVLIDSSSASAAEIFAGAMKDNHRAVIVGQRSFGKGSVQQMFPLGADGAVKFTVSRYFTPSGQSIQAVGVVPDTLAGDDVAGLRESDLPRHLPPPAKAGEAQKLADNDSVDDLSKEASAILKERRAAAAELADSMAAHGVSDVKALEAAQTDSDDPVNPFDVSARAKASDPFMKAALADLADGQGKPGALATDAKAAAPAPASHGSAAIETSLIAPML